MEIIRHFADFFIKAFDIFLHLDEYLGSLIHSYGSWTYLVLFMVIFSETGLVVTPFLPGDSLLFAIGTFCAIGHLDLKIVWPLLVFASVLGDNVNYLVGKTMGEKVFHYENSRIFKKEYLEKTHNFYEKYGAKTLILAKYVPVVRTFAPFVAGVGKMTYRKFFILNILAGFTWISILTLSGYFFGNIPVVRNNFSIVIMAIIFISVLPGFIEFYRARAKKISNP